MSNNGSTIQPVDSNLKVAVNSIQRTLFVERLYVNKVYPADRIIPYDYDNLYPNKIKSIALRSGSTMSAVGKLSEFLSGDGFAQMSQIVNREGQNLWDILRHIATSRALFGGYALHFNYNIFGQITEINPINFDFVRCGKKLDRFIVNEDWKRRNRQRLETEYMPFNPANVAAEIAACGIENYTGQLFYWIPTKSDLYTVTHWDSVLDDAQFEAEAKLYGLSSIQNDYSLSGLLTYPKNLESSAEIQTIKEDLKGDTGAANAGGIRVLGAMPMENMQGWKWFTLIARNNIDALHKSQIETAKFNIFSAFKLPPILCGVESGGMFNEASFADAFNYYNAATETDRKEIERELNKILAYSVWAGLGSVQIVPKKYVSKADFSTPEMIEQKSKETRETAQANLRGTVGGIEGILAIQEKVSTGITTPDSAIEILIEIYGFTEEKARRIIGAPVPTHPQPVA